MLVPYVIDNQTHTMREVLSGLLTAHEGCCLDIATAYFNVGGFEQIKEGLQKLGNLRLILGSEPTLGKHLGLEPEPDAVNGLIRVDLEDLPFDEKTLRSVEDLISFLQPHSIQVRLHRKGFLHAKCWLFYADRPRKHNIYDRFRPMVAIVGSANFTRAGLTSNKELNLTHKVIVDSTEADDTEARNAVGWLIDEGVVQNSPLSSQQLPTIKQPTGSLALYEEVNRLRSDRQLIKSEVGARAILDLEKWFEGRWADAIDFKQALIELLDASKFGRKEYTPYQVYMKALFEYFKNDLETDEKGCVRSAVDLAEFQEDAVKKARKVLARYDGVMVADSVGLGKTWIGKKLLEDYAYHLRQQALVVCPASLRDMWKTELQEAGIAGKILSQEELGKRASMPFPIQTRTLSSLMNPTTSGIVTPSGMATLNVCWVATEGKAAMEAEKNSFS